MNVDALRALMHEHEGRLLRYVSRFPIPHASAREIIQETFRQFARTPESERGPAGAEAVWLFRHARVLALKAPLKAEDTADALERKVTETDLSRMVNELPFPRREALWLRTQEELSFADIASIIGGQEASAEMLWLEATARLRVEGAELQWIESVFRREPSPKLTLLERSQVLEEFIPRKPPAKKGPSAREIAKPLALGAAAIAVLGTVFWLAVPYLRSLADGEPEDRVATMYEAKGVPDSVVHRTRRVRIALNEGPTGQTASSIPKNARVLVKFDPRLVKSFRTEGGEKKKVDKEEFIEVKDAVRIEDGGTLTLLIEIESTGAGDEGSEAMWVRIVGDDTTFDQVKRITLKEIAAGE